MVYKLMADELEVRARPYALIIIIQIYLVASYVLFGLLVKGEDELNGVEKDITDKGLPDGAMYTNSLQGS